MAFVAGQTPRLVAYKCRIGRRYFLPRILSFTVVSGYSSASATTAGTEAMRATTSRPITSVITGISPTGKAPLFRASYSDLGGYAASRRDGGVAAWKREADTEKQSFSARRVREARGETTIFVYDAAGKLPTVAAAAEDARANELNF